MPDEVVIDSFGILLMRRPDGALYFAMDDYVADLCFESREEAEHFLRSLSDRMTKRVLARMGGPGSPIHDPAAWPAIDIH